VDIHAPDTRLDSLVAGHRFDAVIDFLAYTPEDIRRSVSLFRDKTDQFVFISSASAYQKPPKRYLITEETPLENPFWQYSRDKIACEEMLMDEYRRTGFPVTIIRPSLTYGPSQIPIIGASWMHPYTLVDRIKRGQKVIVPGDGTSLWTLTWNADFAVGLLGLLGKRESIGEAFHITSDEVLTWNQIFLELYSALNEEPNMVHIPSDLIAAFDPEQRGTLHGDKINSAVFDNSKIKRFVPEFNCKVTWAEGVRRSLAWFESHPQFQTIDAESNILWDKIVTGYQQAFP
jgi:nucleoside-diphosphate-sugar epimerase